MADRRIMIVTTQAGINDMYGIANYSCGGMAGNNGTDQMEIPSSDVQENILQNNREGRCILRFCVL